MSNRSKQSIEILNLLRRLGRELASKFNDGFWWPPVALILVAVYWYSVAQSIPLPLEKTVEKYGVYGDSFGRLTSLFTALGFGGLIITLLVQQRQIKNQEKVEARRHRKEETARYEEILFRLLDIYLKTLSEVGGGSVKARDVLRDSLDRVDRALVEEGVNGLPKDLQAKFDGKSLTEVDLERIDYLHFRNFKIVSAEINPQGRLVDTFEILLEHMVHGAPSHLLTKAYRDIVFAQVTYIETRYFFLVALAISNRSRLRDLLRRSGFLDRLSRSGTHKLHKAMYLAYWGEEIPDREPPPSIPIQQGRLKRAMRAHKRAGGEPKLKYTPIGVRRTTSSPEQSSDLPN
jgi:hypothetical protein